MKPLVKYRGGKSKDIPSFLSYIPTDFDTYYEPFFGGGAVFFHLEPRKAVINDVNARLMQFYSDVRDNFDELRRQLDELQSLYEANQQEYSRLKALAPAARVENRNEALYYGLRDMFNHKAEGRYLDSVVYFFINKTAYSGMIRYNAQGEYNVPFGRYRNLNTQLVTRRHHELLQGAALYNGDYSAIFGMATERDFMFLDPPYDCIFSDYGNVEHVGGFGEAEHRRLAAAFRQLRCKAMMVIGKTPLTMELYGDMVKAEYFKAYAVNIRNRFRAESDHIIVTNY